MTLVVGIGRNVGETPMPDDTWQHFKDDVRDAVMAHGFTLLFRGEGLGQWTPEDGATVYETAYTIVALEDGPGARFEDLRVRLDVLAATYGQDAIAMTLGETTLSHNAW